VRGKEWEARRMRQYSVCNQYSIACILSWQTIVVILVTDRVDSIIRHNPRTGNISRSTCQPHIHNIHTQHSPIQHSPQIHTDHVRFSPFISIGETIITTIQTTDSLQLANLCGKGKKSPIRQDGTNGRCQEMVHGIGVAGQS
jgi:hypothetical protein